MKSYKINCYLKQQQQKSNKKTIKNTEDNINIELSKK